MSACLSIYLSRVYALLQVLSHKYLFMAILKNIYVQIRNITNTYLLTIGKKKNEKRKTC